MPARGGHLSDEHKKRLGQLLRKQWADPAFQRSVARASTNRLRRNWQDPDYHRKMSIERRKPIAARFWSGVLRGLPEDCWVWTKSVDNRGYGKLSSRRGKGGSPERAHRVSWELHFGTIPQDKEVCHRCDNPRCVNPNHLFLGTHRDNMDDAVAKHRMAHGSNHCCAKLSEQDVVEIRALRHDGVAQRTIARMFGVTHSAIEKIDNGQNWKHVSSQPKGVTDGR